MTTTAVFSGPVSTLLERAKQFDEIVHDSKNPAQTAQRLYDQFQIMIDQAKQSIASWNGLSVAAPAGITVAPPAEPPVAKGRIRTVKSRAGTHRLQPDGVLVEPPVNATRDQIANACARTLRSFYHGRMTGRVTANWVKAGTEWTYGNRTFMCRIPTHQFEAILRKCHTALHYYYTGIRWIDGVVLEVAPDGDDLLISVTIR
jgi:hypothetical protein